MKSIRKKLDNNYKNNLIDLVINTLRLKPVKWSDFWAIFNNIKDKDFTLLREGVFPSYSERLYDKFYGGHHHRLGHYFRHLFAIYNYINNQEGLTYSERYEYAQILRSQFSAYEQSVFCYNTLSFLGRVWDLHAQENRSERPLEDKRLVTKYNIVKNISSELLGVDNLQEIYPLVDFEIGDDSIQKTDLKKKYK